MSSSNTIAKSEKPEILSWVGAGSPASKPTIRLIDLDLIDESDLFRLREPPYPQIDELVGSLRQIGQTTPLFVRPTSSGRYELIAGYRRRTALAAMHAPQAIVRIFEGLSDKDAYELAVSENAERDDLTDWERAQACVKLQSQGRTQEEIATMFHWKDARSVRNFLKVARSAPKAVSNALQAKKLQINHALALTRLADAPFTEADADRITAKAITEGWSVRTIERTIEDLLSAQKSGKETPEESSDPPLRYRQFKSGAVHLSARIDPEHPETFDEIGEHLRKALKLISKYRRQSTLPGPSELSPDEAEDEG